MEREVQRGMGRGGMDRGMENGVWRERGNGENEKEWATDIGTESGGQTEGRKEV